eukprot:CAMPEP_0196718366 /NCGR_PEP_ID=MMETSP1091-20130531/1565_1 /TAXON_ID=302021 /ORGANISM="Rhodomonas sp., Strain CCMP768" /LENGTH=444 /DNA_ID=CAMNT_0042058993 /DNA_START=565 /DNA_END=1899 /DNA_ORIENTATION=-
MSQATSADFTEAKTANNFFETNLQGLRNNPVVRTVLQGNSSMIAAAVTTAGVSLLKRAASNPTIAGTINEFFGEGRASTPGFSATMQDKSVPTTIPHMDKEIQWLPQEWQDWGKEAEQKLKNKRIAPEQWITRARDATEQATMQIKDSVGQWKEETVEQWHKGLQELSRFRELESTSMRLKAWQEQMNQKIQQLRYQVSKVPIGGQRAGGASLNTAEVESQNKMLLGRLFHVLAGDGWEHVLHENGVDVYRKKIVDLYSGGDKFYCIKAVGVIDAKAADLYDLLRDSSRVNEYNEECALVRDIENLGQDTKVTWASSKSYFPFKARDFVTRVHNTVMNDGTFVIMSQSQDMAYKPPEGGDFVRTEVLLSGNVMRPVPGDPTKTQFTTIAHINPGGAADTPLGAQLANKICVHGPVSFIRKLETACGPEALAEEAARANLNGGPA